MTRRQRRVLGFFFLAALACLASRATAREEKPGTLQVDGGTGKLTPLTAEQWAKLPRTTVEIKGKGDAKARYEGVSLAEWLEPTPW